MAKSTKPDVMNRRQVLQTLATAVPATVLAAGALQALAQTPAAKPAGGAAELKLVPDNDPTATALKYVTDGTKAARVEKMGVAAKDQSCKSCQFYTKAGEVKGKEVGKCLMLPAGMVYSTGWCMSWTKKA